MLVPLRNSRHNLTTQLLLRSGVGEHCHQGAGQRVRIRSQQRFRRRKFRQSSRIQFRRDVRYRNARKRLGNVCFREEFD